MLDTKWLQMDARVALVVRSLGETSLSTSVIENNRCWKNCHSQNMTIEDQRAKVHVPKIHHSVAESVSLSGAGFSLGGYQFQVELGNPFVE